jgi:hypothetical protein
MQRRGMSFDTIENSIAGRKHEALLAVIAGD